MKMRRKKKSSAGTGIAHVIVGVFSVLFWLTVGVLKLATWVIAAPIKLGLKIYRSNRCKKVLSGGIHFYPYQIDNIKKSIPDFVGVYILHNRLNNKYYVGQSVHVLKRITQHFSGNGCEDVYKDYTRGMPFEIQCVALANSGYNNLNRLERDYIAYYNAYYNGYNKTKGNHD